PKATLPQFEDIQRARGEFRPVHHYETGPCAKNPCQHREPDPSRHFTPQIAPLLKPCGNLGHEKEQEQGHDRGKACPVEDQRADGNRVHGRTLPIEASIAALSTSPISRLPGASMRLASRKTIVGGPAAPRSFINAWASPLKSLTSILIAAIPASAAFTVGSANGPRSIARQVTHQSAVT